MPDEELARLYEDTDRQLARDRIPDQDEWKKDRRAISIHSNELISRIKLMNPLIWAEDSIKFKHERISLYYPSSLGQLKCYTGAHFAKGMVREFSQVFTDASDRIAWVGTKPPVDYGWREVLRRLLKLRLITWKQVQQHFPIYESSASEAFDRQTRKFKN
jgi:hypothetical protein